MSLREEIVDKMGDLIIAAFGLVAALAWNQAIIAIFKEVFGENWEGVPQMLTYAILVTVIAVLIIIWVARASAKLKDKSEEKSPD